MKYLIVYTHPNPKSFNHAILESVESALQKNKKPYEVRDLYEIRFNPVLSGNDFVAFKQGTFPADIKKEQDYIKKADTLIFIHPIWWYGLPAVLKGYIDRVFSHGFAYAIDTTGLHPLLTDKNVMIFNTTGVPEDQYRTGGFTDAIKKSIDTGTFGLCGMKVILHKFFYGVPYVDDKTRAGMLKEIQAIQFA